ncbi:MAG: tRNA (adenosine(37)-N6)-threonylcarbamoyltransferase complex ATPase subunit type 1 TsaE [Candidatus Pacebacteria bacterium]|nr:tRNA (adenosine(37)-N6)-threonylcarbamoyltransferase complex ATPase subunit type 1 TsaE [Candidatus Paceibacterota bacterium]
MENIVLRSEKELKPLVEKVFRALKSRKSLSVLALSGDLGSGKTTFAKYFAKVLGIKNRILSPTFMIFRVYDLDLKKTGFKKFYHADFYRMKNIEELNTLKFYEIIQNPENLVLIEWAEKFREIILQNAIWMTFEYGKNENERVVEIK